ncbi:MAG: hypothetical protein LBH20_06575 [Treponema sp.]|jgi:hypothetical protein|nr:hypothetical protein [Treponema sp.]
MKNGNRTSLKFFKLLYVGGRAVDVSVRSLNTQQKQNFAQILRNKGIEVIYEYYGGSSSEFHVSIERANLFHCYY